MKWIYTLFLISLTLNVNAWTFTNIYTGSAPGDHTGDPAHIAFGKVNTNSYYLTNLISGVVSNALMASIQTTSNSVSSGPSLIFTNWISGQLYTNLSGRLQFVSVTAVTTYSTVSGTALQRLQTGAQGVVMTNISQYGAQTIVGSLGTTNCGYIGGYIQNANVFTFTNLVIGAGDVAINLPGTGQQVTY